MTSINYKNYNLHIKRGLKLNTNCKILQITRTHELKNYYTEKHSLKGSYYWQDI
jgi:hypothetical protein